MEIVKSALRTALILSGALIALLFLAALTSIPLARDYINGVFLGSAFSMIVAAILYRMLQKKS